MLCPSLHTMIHLQPITLVLHTHTSSLNIHYTGTKLNVLCTSGEDSNLSASASTIFTLFTHYTADKRVGNMKYSKFQQNQDKQKDKCFILKFVVFIQNIYSALKISHPSPLKFASLVRLFLARSDIILLNVFFSLGICTLLQ